MKQNVEVKLEDKVKTVLSQLQSKLTELREQEKKLSEQLNDCQSKKLQVIGAISVLTQLKE